MQIMIASRDPTSTWILVQVGRGYLNVDSPSYALLLLCEFAIFLATTPQSSYVHPVMHVYECQLHPLDTTSHE